MMDLRAATLIALDVETTGLDPAADRVIEVAAVRFTIDPPAELATFSTLINPERPIPEKITQITGLTDADVAGAPVAAAVLPSLRRRRFPCLGVPYDGLA